MIITENLSWTVIEESQARDFEDVLVEPSTESYEKEEVPQDHGDSRSTRLIKHPIDRDRGSNILFQSIYLIVIYDMSAKNALITFYYSGRETLIVKIDDFSLEGNKIFSKVKVGIISKVTFSKLEVL